MILKEPSVSVSSPMNNKLPLRIILKLIDKLVMIFVPMEVRTPLPEMLLPLDLNKPSLLVLPVSEPPSP